MSDTSVSYLEGLHQRLQDPEAVVAYLNAALEENDQELFLLALRNVADSRGMSLVAQESNLNRENLYRMLSEQGNPQLSSLNTLLHSIGLRLAVELEAA